LNRDYEALNIVATYNLLYNAAIMVEEGIEYAVCLDKLINTTSDSRLCFHPLKPRMDVDLYIAWKRFQVFSKADEKFLRIFQKRLAEK